MNADDPWEVCYANMLRGLYPPVKRKGFSWVGNPVREEICGTESSIRRITPAVLRDAHKRFYCPENMVLAVSGRITPDEVEAAVACAWSDVAPASGRTPPPSRLTGKREPTGDSALAAAYKPRVTASMETAKPLFTIGIKLPHVPDDAASLVALERRMTVLSEMLFSRSGDLYDRLFEEGIINPGISYGSSLGRPSLGGRGDGYGYFYFSGECDQPERVYEAFLHHVESMTRDGLDSAAFECARRTMYADYIYGFDSTEGIASALMTAALDGVGLYDLARVDGEMTLSEITELFRQAFVPAQYTLSTVLPSE